jgi:hypothetical protein
MWSPTGESSSGPFCSEFTGTLEISGVPALSVAERVEGIVSRVDSAPGYITPLGKENNTKELKRKIKRVKSILNFCHLISVLFRI